MLNDDWGNDKLEKKLIMQYKVWLAFHPTDNACHHCKYYKSDIDDCGTTVYYPIDLYRMACLVFLYEGNYVK